MTVSYVWMIETCERDIATGGITVAHWRVSATDGTYTVSAYGTVGFTPDPTSPDFKPYDQVTEAEVLSWVWGSVDKEAAEASLAQQIDALENPTTASGVPWS